MIEEIERLNEWWFTGKIRKDLSPDFKRDAFGFLQDSLRERQILIITGLRRIGKTVLLYQTIEHLLKTVEPSHILYFCFEEPVSPKAVIELYEKRILKKPLEECGKIFMFFDEIQYAKNWASTVKAFYDLYPNIKFFLSGSSSLLLSREALSKLAGRFSFMKLKPLTFSEFLRMKGLSTESEIGSRRIESYFFDYLRKTGFPEIADWENDIKISEYITNSVVDRVVLKDLPIIFSSRDLMLAEKIVKLILSNPGCIINVNSLSKSWSKSKITISNYLRLLEISLIIKSLENYRPTFMSASRKLKKYYPATTSLVFANSKEFFEKNLGAVLETYAVNTLDAKYYFRDATREVDILLKNDGVIPVEVKEQVSEQDIKKFLRLIDFFKSKKGFMISLNQTLEKEKISVIPSYLIEQFFSRTNKFS